MPREPEAFIKKHVPPIAGSACCATVQKEDKRQLSLENTNFKIK